MLIPNKKNDQGLYVLMYTVLAESITREESSRVAYSKLIKAMPVNYDLINIIIIENIWTDPLVLFFEEIVRIIENIKTGSIVIYLYGAMIEELIPVSDLASKSDILEYLKLKIPDILPSQWSNFTVERATREILQHEHVDSFRERNIIFVHKPQTPHVTVE